MHTIKPDMHTIKPGMHTAKPASSRFQNRKIFRFLKVDKIGDEKFRSANTGSL